MASASAPTLRRGLHVVGQGIRQQPRWFALAVLGSTVYGVMTVGLAWAIGKVTDEVVAPAVAARQVEAGQLWWAGLVLTAVVLLNVIGIVVRRVAAGITFNNLGATYRRRVTRQYLRLPLSWHHRHPSGSCCPTPTPTSRPPGRCSTRCRWRSGSSSCSPSPPCRWSASTSSSRPSA